MGTRRRVRDILDGVQVPGLTPIQSCSPFTDPSALVEEHLFESCFDFVHRRLVLLFSTWSGICELDEGNVGCLVCNDVREFGWKMDPWDVRRIPYWWTVLGHDFVSIDDPPRVEIRKLMPTPYGAAVALPDESESELFRFALDFLPSAQMVIASEAASYYIGDLTRPSDEDLENWTVSTEDEVNWLSVAHWSK